MSKEKTMSKTCDICKCELKTEYVDGKTFQGPWANMCLTCFGNFGLGLGLGLGQWYKKDSSGNWKKVQG